MKTKLEQHGLGMASNTNSHNLFMQRLRNAMAKRLAPRCDGHVAIEVSVKEDDKSLYPHIEPDISVWRKCTYTTPETLYEDLLLVVEIVHNNKNRQTAIVNINKAFDYQPTMREAFILDYAKVIWSRFERENGETTEKKNNDNSILLDCHLNSILQECVGQESTLIEMGEYQVDGDRFQIFNELKINLTSELRSKSRYPKCIQSDYNFTDPRKLSRTVKPMVSIWEKATLKNKKLILDTPIAVIDIIYAENESPESYYSVCKAMEYEPSIMEALVYNYATGTWKRFTRDAKSGRITSDESDWCRTARVHLGRFVEL